MSDPLSAADFDSLLNSPAFRAFQAYVSHEWGDAGVKYQAELSNALNLTDNDAAASQARQIVSGKKVIAALMRWPQEEQMRLRKLEQMKTEEPAMSRRGSL